MTIELRDLRWAIVAAQQMLFRLPDVAAGSGNDPEQSLGLPQRVKAACPEGIDIYFENVGGPVFDAVLPLLNTFARIPVCGLIAQAE